MKYGILSLFGLTSVAAFNNEGSNLQEEHEHIFEYCYYSGSTHGCPPGKFVIPVSSWEDIVSGSEIIVYLQQTSFAFPHKIKKVENFFSIFHSVIFPSEKKRKRDVDLNTAHRVTEKGRENQG